MVLRDLSARLVSTSFMRVCDSAQQSRQEEAYTGSAVAKSWGRFLRYWVGYKFRRLETEKKIRLIFKDSLKMILNITNFI